MPKYMPKPATMETTKSKDGMVGLSYPMLARTNYTAWSIKMRVFMQAQGVWEAVEQSDTKGVVEAKTDKVALAAIYQGIPEDMLLSIAEKKTAKEAWEALKLMCMGADRVKLAKVQTLKTELESLNMKEGDQLEDFCMKVNGIVTNIRTLGETMEESYVVKKLLRAMPSKFLQIASTIEQFGDVEKMTIDEVVGRLKAHEERMRGQIENTGSSGGKLLLTQEEWSKRSNKNWTPGTHNQKPRNTTYNRGRGRGTFRNAGFGRGQQSRQEEGSRRNNQGRDRSTLKCFNCNGYGHYASECRKPKREKGREGDAKSEANLTQIPDDEPALLVAECGVKPNNVVLLNEEAVIPKLSHGENVQSNLWYLDNGASNHMTGHREKFKTLDEGVTGKVKFGDGSTVEIKGKGSIILKCKNGEERLLHEVYFIPSLCSNIISLGQLSENGNKVIMHGDFLWIYEKQGDLLMKVKRSLNRLYKIIIESSSNECLLSKSEETSWLWHSRLGHVNFKAMKLMSNAHMADGIPDFVQPKEICSGCLLSKQARKPFPAQSTFVAKKILGLVHADLCGPISPPTPSGNRYFFLLVDDFSRIMWVFMLKTKDEALEHFKKFRVLVEKETKEVIQTLRTDRGGEFVSKAFEEYCQEAGIQRHLTAPYTPQQNGVVERRNRTVVAMARSFLKEKGLPSFFWGEAVRQAVYILNRLPTRALSEVTPYQAWTDSKPNLGHIKVFGCLAHMKIAKAHTGKLDDRSKPVVYFGKEPGTKAYRLYDPNTGRIHVSRDVVFEENKSWDWSKQVTEGSKSLVDSFVVINIDAETQGESQPNDSQTSGEGVTTPVSSQTPVSSSTDSQSNESQGEVARNLQRDFDDAVSSQNSEHSAESTEPRKFRLLSDVYNDTEEVELPDDELLYAGIDEPTGFSEAVKESEWKVAMQTEIDAIEKNQTWVLTDLPAGRKAINLKWVYKLKRDTNGQIIKHKARLVAKGYVQKKGVDFDEVFAPVTRLETVRLLLALSAKNGWEAHHLDVKSAFLNGELLEEVYVTQPEGFVKKGKENKVYRLLKALYGLRQAPRAWYAKLNRSLRELGFEKCPYEHAVYTKREGDECLIVAVYVDDLLITGSSVSNINKFKQEMKNKFEMSDLGKLAYYLGIEVDQRNKYIELRQSAYARKLLEKAGMLSCNPVKNPMETKVVLSKDEKGKQVNETQYRSLVGGLRYLVHTRPDIAYAVGVVSRYMERPTVLHYNAVKRILRYVKGTLEYGLVYSKGTGNYLLAGFSDSNLAGDTDDRKSTSGMCFYLNENLITWVSQKQRCVALSTCEAEFMAATAAACQGIWLRNLLMQVTDIGPSPVVIYVDNKSAIDLTKNPVFHGRSKHIHIRYHFIRDCIERGEVIVKFVRTGEQRADMLTKALSVTKFEEMRKLMGMKSLD